MKNRKLRWFVVGLALAMGGPSFRSAAAETDEQKLVPPQTDATTHVPPAMDMPELLRPVTLTDEDGNPETGFVDPFSRRADGEGAAMPGEDGLMRTTMGEISSEFRILAITIPQDEALPRAALIQFHDSDEPILVHEGDLVRVDRTGVAKRRGRTSIQRSRASARGQDGGKARLRPGIGGGRAELPLGRRNAQTAARGMSDADIEEQLGKFVFYLNVKHIEPGYIEVYHNKKRPDETIRLNW